VLVKSSMHSGTIRVTAGNGRATWSTTRSVAPPVPPGDDHTYVGDPRADKVRSSFGRWSSRGCYLRVQGDGTLRLPRRVGRDSLVLRVGQVRSGGAPG
jgi:hypothetical protein